jgi:hypothetical protein
MLFSESQGIVVGLKRNNKLKKLFKFFEKQCHPIDQKEKEL